MEVVPQNMTVAGTSLGKLRYDDEDPEAFRIHAADDVQLKFTYTADQRIQAGQLILTIPRADGWTTPQESHYGSGKVIPRVDSASRCNSHRL